MSRRDARRLVVVCAATLSALVGNTPLQAQDPSPSRADAPAGPPELVAAQAAFVDAVAKRLQPLNRSYIEALRKLEKQLATAGDYRGAIAARGERRIAARALAAATMKERIVQAPAPAPAPPTEPLIFSVADADSKVGVEIADGQATIGRSDSSIVWKLEAPIPGNYAVAVSYKCAEPSEFWVKESFFRLRASLPAALEWRTAVLGTLKVTSEATGLTLEGIEIPGRGLLLRHITLTEVPK